MSQMSKRQHGMTLLEVVVSMLLIGLGMAASISMIQEGMRSNISALNRNTALYLSEAMIDKIRVNSFALPQYLSGSASELHESADKVKKKNCTSSCSENQNAAYAQARKDMEVWAMELNEKLPDAKYAIYPENSRFGRYTIKIVWPNRIINRGDKTDDGGKIPERSDEMVTVFTL